MVECCEKMMVGKVGGFVQSNSEWDLNHWITATAVHAFTLQIVHAKLTEVTRSFLTFPQETNKQTNSHSHSIYTQFTKANHFSIRLKLSFIINYVNHKRAKQEDEETNAIDWY